MFRYQLLDRSQRQAFYFFEREYLECKSAEAEAENEIDEIRRRIEFIRWFASRNLRSMREIDRRARGGG